MNLVQVFTTIVVIGFTLSGFSQHTLTVEIRNCKKDQLDSTLLFFSITHRKASEIVNIGTYTPRGKSTIYIPNLAPGNYWLHYKNAYKELKQIPINILGEEDTTAIILCPDRYNNDAPNHTPLISQLREGEHLNLIMGSHGCYISSQDTLTISRNNHIYYLSHNRGEKRVLSADEYGYIQQFENELNLFDRNGACTTEDAYEIIYKEQHYKFKDDSCDWGGVYSLMNQLELKMTMDY